MIHESSNQSHQGQPILTGGEPLAQARAAMIMAHGRGASARDILMLGEQLNQSGFAYLAPQAKNSTWYPNRFMEPIESNEPWLSSALQLIETLLAQVSAAGIPPEHTMFLGFSQGACLTLEFTARHAQRYGGIVGLSGGLIGPDGTPRDYAGSLDGTPIFLGCSENDFHIPKERVLETADVMQHLGAHVTTRLYSNMGHEVNLDEIKFIRDMMQNLQI
jgi:predicted esterase